MLASLCSLVLRASCSDADFAVIKSDISMCAQLGVAGVVCGMLTLDGRVDEVRTSELLALASSSESSSSSGTPQPLQFTFHRAFDMTRDLTVALDTLMRIGVQRVLTSGGANDAITGQDVIRVSRVQINAERWPAQACAVVSSALPLVFVAGCCFLLFSFQSLVGLSAGRLVILAGGGLNEENLADFVRHTGVREVHGSLRSALPPPLEQRFLKPGVFMGGEKRNIGAETEYEIKVADETKIRTVTTKLRELSREPIAAAPAAVAAVTATTTAAPTNS